MQRGDTETGSFAGLTNGRFLEGRFGEAETRHVFRAVESRCSAALFPTVWSTPTRTVTFISDSPALCFWGCRTMVRPTISR